MTQSPRFIKSIAYAEPWSWAELDRERDVGEYPASMTDGLVEAISILDGWAVPLVVGIVFEPVDEPTDETAFAVLLVATEVTTDTQYHKAWATPDMTMNVDGITGDVVRSVIHERLSELEETTNRRHHVFNMQFLAGRFAIGATAVAGEFLLSSWGGSETRHVETTESDGQRWISEPKTDGVALLPVGLEVSGLHLHDHELRFSMSPNWSFFGDNDSPGWPTIKKAAETLVSLSDLWTITRLESRDPTGTE